MLCGSSPSISNPSAWHPGRSDVMPKMSGEEIVRKLSRLSADLPIVMMSGYQESDVLTRLPGVKLAGYLQKPFRLPVVMDLLQRSETFVEE